MKVTSWTLENSGKSTDLYIALLFMLLMMVSYSISWLRLGVGKGIDSVFAPLVESFNIPFFILIVILSAATGLYSSIIQKYTIDYERMTDVAGADEGVPERVSGSHALPG